MAGILKEIAAQMWAEARQNGRSVRRLSGGLMVGCRVDGETRQFGVSRGRDRVDYQEAVIACNAFGVPRDVKRDDTSLAGQTWAMYTWSSAPAPLQVSLWEN